AAWPALSIDRQPGMDAENVEYPSRDLKIQGYLAKPKAEGIRPAVMLIHDDGGLNDHIRELARRLATSGFVALAPDLLSRAGGLAKMKTSEEAAEALNRLSVDASVQDMKSGFSWLQSNLKPSSGKISAVGFGWGGWHRFLL